jgi:hypothetical protein
VHGFRKSLKGTEEASTAFSRVRLPGMADNHFDQLQAVLPAVDMAQTAILAAAVFVAILKRIPADLPGRRLVVICLPHCSPCTCNAYRYDVPTANVLFGESRQSAATVYSLKHVLP